MGLFTVSCTGEWVYSLSVVLVSGFYSLSVALVIGIYLLSVVLVSGFIHCQLYW